MTGKLASFSMLGQQEHLNRNLINHENTSLIEEKNIN